MIKSKFELLLREYPALFNKLLNLALSNLKDKHNLITLLLFGM